MNKISSRFDSQVGQQRRDEATKTEARTMADLERKDRERAEAEAMKVEVRRRDAKRNFDYNTVMIEEKKRQKERERMDALETRLRLQEDLRLAEAKEKQKTIERKLQGRELKYQLDDQVRVHQANKTSGSVLSDVEMVLNKVRRYYFIAMCNIVIVLLG